MKNKLKNAVHYIEANRDEMGDKKALDLLIKALKKIAAEAFVWFKGGDGLTRHKAKFTGQILYKNYMFNVHPMLFSKDVEICEVLKPFISAISAYDKHGVYSFVDHSIGEKKIFFEGEIDGEPINVGEKVYIKGINDYIVIKDRYRNLNSEWTYETDHIVKIIEDEETILSKEWAVKQYEEALMDIEHEKRYENADAVKANESWLKRLFN